MWRVWRSFPAAHSAYKMISVAAPVRALSLDVAQPRRRGSALKESFRPHGSRASVPTVGTLVSPSQLAQYDCVREGAIRAARAERMALQLDSVCIEADASLRIALTARHDQQLAWLVLCDRGWPADQAVEGFDIVPVHDWLMHWSDLVALPVRIMSPRHLVKIHRIRRRLERCEAALRPSLPASMWQIVGPLDETGRSTLACVLQALVACVDACAWCDMATRQKKRLAVWLSLFTHQARSLRLTVPAAPLDLDGWRRVASEARALAAIARPDVAA